MQRIWPDPVDRGPRPVGLTLPGALGLPVPTDQLLDDPPLKPREEVLLRQVALRVIDPLLATVDTPRFLVGPDDLVNQCLHTLAGALPGGEILSAIDDDA